MKKIVFKDLFSFTALFLFTLPKPLYFYSHRALVVFLSDEIIKRRAFNKTPVWTALSISAHHGCYVQTPDSGGPFGILRSVYR